MEVRIAVISDLHCQTRAPGVAADSYLFCDDDACSVKSHPVKSLLQLIESNKLSADVLLVAGDLTHKIDAPGFKEGWRQAKEISSLLGSFGPIATLGNHDVDSRATIGRDPFSVAKSIGDDFPVPSLADQDQFWSRGYAIVDVNDDLRVLVIDSSREHWTESEARHGGISERALEKLERDLSSLSPVQFQLALAHHHPVPHEELNLGTYDVMENGTQLVRLLEDFGFCLFVHGHKHFPRLIYAQGGTESMPVFSAGSLASTNREWGVATNTRNLFHIVSIDSESLPGCTHTGMVQTWEFNQRQGWNTPSMRSAGIPPTTGFGCRILSGDLVIMTTQLIGVDERIGWDRLIEQLPQMKYLIPRDHQVYVKRLAELGIAVDPADSYDPTVVGYPWKGKVDA